VIFTLIFGIIGTLVSVFILATLVWDGMVETRRNEGKQVEMWAQTGAEHGGDILSTSKTASQAI
jgi:hypothetical protein